MSKVCGLILAAGESKRMGSPKQLLDIKGQPLIKHSLDTALGSHAQEWIVVLGAYADRICPLIEDLACHICICPDWELGMGNSLSAGIRYAKSLPNFWDAYLLMVCDQPFLKSAHLNLLITHWEKTKLSIASFYNGTKGVPAIFDKSTEPQLMRHHGPKGAGVFLQGKEINSIPLEKGEIDLDYPEDYQKLSQPFK